MWSQGRSAKSGFTVYQILVDLHKKPPSTKALWNTVFNCKNFIWTNVYIERLCLVKEQKLVAFNFKILNDILATPVKLCKLQLIENYICYMCFSSGTLEHMMLKCSYFEEYYKTVLYIFESHGYGNVQNNLYTLVCGYKPATQVYHGVNMLLNVIFFTVYKCWLKIKFERKYINPLVMLRDELSLRCSSDIYNSIHLFKQFTNTLKMHV